MSEFKVGSKFDEDKNRLELVDALAIEGIGKVLTFGAKKYSADNWRGGIQYTRLIGAIKRHLSSIERGEDVDPESGLPHIDHLGCEWMFMSNFMKTRLDLDDRWTTRITIADSEYAEVAYVETVNEDC